MITVESPIKILTELGAVLITVQHEDGQIIIETFQRFGKKRYRLSKHALDGTLIEEPWLDT